MTLCVAIREGNTITAACDTIIYGDNLKYRIGTKLWRQGTAIFLGAGEVAPVCQLRRRICNPTRAHSPQVYFDKVAELFAECDGDASCIGIGGNQIFHLSSHGDIYEDTARVVCQGAGAEYAYGFLAGRGPTPAEQVLPDLFLAASQTLQTVGEEFDSLVVPPWRVG